MSETETYHPKKKDKTLAAQVFDVLSGFGLASILLVLLLILTWLGTLEQTERGLYLAVKKYFSSESFFIFPEYRLYAEQEKAVKIPIPLISGYWVCALLFINMFLGGLVRAKKGIKSLGAIIAHFAILFMLAGGAITHHFSERGNMQIYEGAESDVAEAYQEWSLEVREHGAKDGDQVTFVDHEYLDELKSHHIRRFEFPNLPFDLEIYGWVLNAEPVGAIESAPRNKEPVVDGYYLRERKPALEAERNLPGCYARPILKDGTKLEPFILPAASYHPYTVRIEDRTFSVHLRKQLWPMPFMVKLADFIHEYDPGTNRAANYESDILRIQDGEEIPVEIKMNEPMRYDGFTFFQASWGPQDAKPGQNLYSVFEVVKNPADKWPEWACWIVGFGMLLQFMIKLGRFVGTGSKKGKV